MTKELSSQRSSSDGLLILAVIVMAAYSFMGMTNFVFNWPPVYGIPLKAQSVCHVIVCFYAIYNIVTSDSRREKALFIAFILLWLYTSNVLPILWAALSGRSMRKYLSIGVGTTMTMFAVTILSAVHGVIGMGAHGAWEGNFYGMTTQGQFGFVLLFVMMTAVVLRRGIFQYYEYVIMYVILYLNWHIYTRKNSNLCMLVLLVLCAIRQTYLALRKDKGVSRKVRWLQKYIFDYSFIWAYGLYVICVYARNLLRLLQPKIPLLRSFILRVDDAAEIWRAFPMALFGRNIREFGGSNATTLLFDPLYSRTLLYEGLVMLVIFMTVSTYFMVKARHEEQGAIYIVFMVMALFSMADPCAWGIAVNFLIALPFAVWDIGKPVNTGEASTEVLRNK